MDRRPHFLELYGAVSDMLRVFAEVFGPGDTDAVQAEARIMDVVRRASTAPTASAPTVGAKRAAPVSAGYY